MIGDSKIIVLDVSDKSIEECEDLERKLEDLSIPYSWIDDWVKTHRMGE